MSPVWWRAVTHLTSSLRADGLVWGILHGGHGASPSLGRRGWGRGVSRCGTVLCGTALHLRWPEIGLRSALGARESSLAWRSPWLRKVGGPPDQRIQVNGEPGGAAGRVELVRVQLPDETRCEKPSCRKVGPVAPAVQLSEEMERVCPESSSWEPSGATREKEKPPIR